MITKQRLEELINNKSNVYYLTNHLSNGEGIWIDLSNAEIYNDDLLKLNYTIFYNTCSFNLVDIKNLFETRKQADKQVKWTLKYYKTRTEKLELPMWEDWQRLNGVGKYAISFCAKKHGYCELVVFQDRIRVTKERFGKEVLFNEPNTEENYKKACDLCLKLFEGEE